jgi:hypothetical protein
MAGLVPAIHVLGAARSKTWIPGTRPGMTKCEQVSRTDTALRKFFFARFVDPIFTTSPQAPFTKSYEAIALVDAIACLCHARHVD